MPTSTKTQTGPYSKSHQWSTLPPVAQTVPRAKPWLATPTKSPTSKRSLLPPSSKFSVCRPQIILFPRAGALEYLSNGTLLTDQVRQYQVRPCMRAPGRRTRPRSSAPRGPAARRRRVSHFSKSCLYAAGLRRRSRARATRSRLGTRHLPMVLVLLLPKWACFYFFFDMPSRAPSLAGRSASRGVFTQERGRAEGFQALMSP